MKTKSEKQETDKLNEEAEKKKTEKIIQKLEEHLVITNDNVTYALNRFDILIISLSSGGLALSIGLVKNLIPNLNEVDTSCLKYSWALFGASIILNLLSQVTSYFANFYELKVVTNLIRIKKGKSVKGNQNCFECVKKVSNFLTNCFNLLSLITFITAVFFLIFFMLFQEIKTYQQIFGYCYHF